MSANISSQMSSLVKKIEKWDFEFNQNGFSSVSNDVYDAIFEELISLEKKHPDLVLNESPTHQIFYLTKKNSKLNNRYNEFVQSGNNENLLAQQNAFNALMDECKGGSLSSAIARYFVKQKEDVTSFFFQG